MIPTAQSAAIDLGRTNLQVSDSSTNSVSTTVPDGSFTALLQTQPSDAAQLSGNEAGATLPVTGSELPAEENTVPIPQPVTEFVAFYEGDDDALATTMTEDSIARSDAEDAAEPAVIPGLAGLAPPSRAETNADSQNRREVRGDGRMGLHAVGGRGFSRRDHGRVPFAQPMSPPDRMIFKTGGQGGEIVLGGDAAEQAFERALSADETATTVSDRRRPGLGMPGLMLNDQGNRVVGEPVGGFELPIQRDGAESATRPTAAVQVSTVAGQLPEVRDLSAATKPTPVFATTIGQTVMDKAWGEAFQERVLWMATGRIQNAEIRLNPAELGPIRVQVSVEDDAAVLNFTAQHNVTREAIEQALPRLREMLSENGLTLAESTVSDSSDREAAGEHGPSGAESTADEETGQLKTDDAGSIVEQRIKSDSLVDTFA